jgi:hypothetical protein
MSCHVDPDIVPPQRQRPIRKSDAIDLDLQQLPRNEYRDDESPWGYAYDGILGLRYLFFGEEVEDRDLISNPGWRGIYDGIMEKKEAVDGIRLIRVLISIDAKS